MTTWRTVGAVPDFEISIGDLAAAVSALAQAPPDDPAQVSDDPVGWILGAMLFSALVRQVPGASAWLRAEPETATLGCEPDGVILSLRGRGEVLELGDALARWLETPSIPARVGLVEVRVRRLAVGAPAASPPPAEPPASGAVRPIVVGSCIVPGCDEPISGGGGFFCRAHARASGEAPGRAG